MSRTAGPFLGPRENLTALTVVGPKDILGKLREVSERLGISRHVLAALAIDEYVRRHYPEEQEEEHVEQSG
jgi:predicted transcriptional regulator